MGDFNSNSGMAYNYYQSYNSPFDQFDKRAFNAHNNAFSPHNHFDQFGSGNYNDPYASNCQEGIRFPEADLGGPHASGNNIFSAFDRQEMVGPFAGASSAENESLQFPANSHLTSTSTTSNNIRQFQAYTQPTSRISCPIKMMQKSELDYKAPSQGAKFRSGEAKSLFMK